MYIYKYGEKVVYVLVKMKGYQFKLNLVIPLCFLLIKVHNYDSKIIYCQLRLLQDNNNYKHN
jgi:hypothetical protein